MSLPESSVEAFCQLKEDGVIEERQELAYETVRRFHEEYEKWPTQREAHVYLVQELDLLDKEQRSRAITDGYRYLGRRMGELVEDDEDDYPDLLEKQEKREHEYLQEHYPGADSGREGEPHRIIDLKQAESASQAESPDEEEPEIGYKILKDDGVTDLRMGAPSEAIQETDDLDFVKQQLRGADLFGEYQEELEARRQDPTGSVDEGDDGLVEKDGEEYLFDPDEDEGSEAGDSETVESSEADDEILMKSGEVVV